MPDLDLISVLVLGSALCLGLYIYTSYVVTSRLPTLENSSICLLIAHPDDEAMFFAPTVQHLTTPGPKGNHLKILCLSQGNAEGLGSVRRDELTKSGLILGLRRPSDVIVLDEERFEDSMTKTWAEEDIVDVLTDAFAPYLSKKADVRAWAKEKKSTTPSIQSVITFDRYGVSSHPNHIGLHHGARAFIKKLGGSKSSPVVMYSLTSVPVYRKYTAIFDCFATLGLWMLSMARNLRSEIAKERAKRAGKKPKGSATNVNSERPPKLVFLNGVWGQTSVTKAWSAMTKAHVSQMVWFRYGWITLSRYMYMNDLALEHVEAPR